MDEPILIEHKKLKIHHKRKENINNVYMPLHIWWELILKHLGLLDLIIISRVCRSFYTYKPLKKLINDKIKTAFSGIKQTHRNKIESINNSRIVTIDFLNRHSGKLLFVQRIGLWHFVDNYKLGAFSSKTLLFNLFKTNYELHYKKEWYCSKQLNPNYVCFSYYERNMDIYTGINELIEDWIQKNQI